MIAPGCADLAEVEAACDAADMRASRSVALARERWSSVRDDGQVSAATASRSMDCPVISAMSSKSLSRCKTVSPADSAVAAMRRSGIDGARMLAKLGKCELDCDRTVLDLQGEVLDGH